MLLSEESDEVLFGLLQDNHDRAFTILYNRYWEILLDVAYAKLQSQDDAKDVVQQVFTQLWNRRGSVKLVYTFRTYVSSALKYKIYDKILERKRKRHVGLEDLSALETGECTTDHHLDYNELRQQLEVIIEQLPLKCRLVYRLSREESLSAKEIAQRLEISEKTVEGHLTKALKVLKLNFRTIFIAFLINFC